jgi:tetratricopeptide (TPR) repeat protein
MRLSTLSELTVTAAAALVLAFAGCDSAALEAQQQQVQENQQQIEQQQQEIESLKANGTSSYSPGVAPPAGGCDRATADAATKRGGDKFASGDYQHALGYYKDALTACPGDARAEINVARTYEALGDRQSAIEHYRAAASSGGAGSDEARNALTRLGSP